MYIYYQVREENARALQSRVSQMQAGLARTHGVDCSLKRRPQAKDGRHTWMEVYLAAPEDFGSALEHAVRQAEIPALIDNERHVEYFLDGSSCA